MTEDERQRRGEDARRILDSEIFQDALAALDAVYVKAWKNGKTPEAREDAHRYIQLIDKFVADLKSVMMDGDIVKERNKELEGKPSRRIWG